MSRAAPRGCSVSISFFPLVLGNDNHIELTFSNTHTRSEMTHRGSAILYDVLKSLFLFIYFPPCSFFAPNLRGGLLVPLISARPRLIKTISARGVGGASVLFAQFKCFITNFRSLPIFRRVHISFINNQHNPSLMYVCLDQSQSDPVGRVEILLCFLSGGGGEGFKTIKISIFYCGWCPQTE